MQLTPQHMSEIYTKLKSTSTANHAGSEKRRATRLTVQGRINLWHAKEFPHSLPHTVLTRDISLTGIALFQGFPLAPGEEFVIELQREKHPSIYVLTRVQFMNQPAENLFCIGAEFVRILEKTARPAATPAAEAPHATVQIPAHAPNASHPPAVAHPPTPEPAAAAPATPPSPKQDAA